MHRLREETQEAFHDRPVLIEGQLTHGVLTTDQKSLTESRAQAPVLRLERTDIHHLKDGIREFTRFDRIDKILLTPRTDNRLTGEKRKENIIDVFNVDCLVWRADHLACYNTYHNCIFF
ncbi:MAG: hypothetical protein PUC72_00965 [Bacteroidales bacterium]|nr:hypothetical protein [Bacteroidales bacterium]